MASRTKPKSSAKRSTGSSEGGGNTKRESRVTMAKYSGHLPLPGCDQPRRYACSPFNGFINYDPREYITENAHVRSGLTGETLRWAFTAYTAVIGIP